MISKMDGKNGGSLDESATFLLETPFDEWSTNQLAEYFRGKTDICDGDYSEMIATHKITGRVAHRLKDQDLKDMGVTTVGDRLAIMDEIEKITRIQQVFVLCIRVSLCIYA